MLVLALVTVLTCALPCLSDDDLETAIKDVFGMVGGDNPQEQDDQNLVTCECMPFYLCKNNSLNEYGENVIDIRLGAHSDCPHYIDRCCTGTTSTPVKPVQPYTSSCGTRHPEGVGFRITGGTDSESNYGELPWMVAVLRREEVSDEVVLKIMACGGSIIHPRVVLTGAHCVRGKKSLTVRAGEWDTQTDKELYPIQERDVQEVIVHEKFYAGGLHNDIALLVLESPLELTEVVDRICLPEQDEVMDGRRCLVSGWGKDAFGREGKYQVILKRVEQPVIPRGPCQDTLRKTRLGPRFKLHQSFLCAGGEIGKDACKGDGGGPLVCPSKNNPDLYVQAGIVAWGVGCGTETPAVYANVPHFRKWIEKKLAVHNITI